MKTMPVFCFMFLTGFAVSCSGDMTQDRSGLVVLMEKYLYALAKHGIKNGWE